MPVKSSKCFGFANQLITQICDGNRRDSGSVCLSVQSVIMGYNLSARQHRVCLGLQCIELTQLHSDHLYSRHVCMHCISATTGICNVPHRSRMPPAYIVSHWQHYAMHGPENAIKQGSLQFIVCGFIPKLGASRRHQSISQP